METNKLLIFSAPSGAGKSTIVGHLMRKFPQLAFSVSATTRAARAGEQEGREYYFLQIPEFKALIAQDAFVEWEEVYPNQFYGTLYKELERIASMDKIAVFDIDVMGGVHLKQRFGSRALSIFIVPPSLEALRDRLIKRNTDSSESIAKRVAKAAYELRFRDSFDLCIVNDNLDSALKKAEETVRSLL